MIRYVILCCACWFAGVAYAGDLLADAPNIVGMEPVATPQGIVQAVAQALGAALYLAILTLGSLAIREVRRYLGDRAADAARDRLRSYAAEAAEIAEEAVEARGKAGVDDLKEWARGKAREKGAVARAYLQRLAPDLAPDDADRLIRSVLRPLGLGASGGEAAAPVVGEPGRDGAANG